MVLLVKPQFEAGRAEVDRGRGVIVDPAIHERVRDEVGAALTAAGCTVVGWMDSPILGGQGNREFLVHAVTAAGGRRMTAVAVVAHHERQTAAALARRGRDVADRAGSRRLGHPRRRHRTSGSPTSSASSRSASADLVVCLGGDGTMLRAVRLLDGAPVPLLGVNVGVLGYLTEIDPPELTTALDRFVAGTDAGGWHLDERMMLEVTAAGQRRGAMAGAQRSGRREARGPGTPCACWRASPASRSRATPPTG